MVVGLAMKAILKPGHGLPSLVESEISVLAHEEKSHEALTEVLKKGGEGMLERAKKALTSEERDEASGMAAMDETKYGKAAFLDRIAEMPTIVAQQLSEAAPASLDDVDLTALAIAFDAENHKVGHYTHVINDLLSRYEKNQIGKLGRLKQEPNIRTTTILPYSVVQTVKIEAYGKTRTAIVRQEVEAGTLPAGMGLSESTAQRVGKPRFERFVDADFVQLAHARSVAGIKEDFAAFDTSEVWTTDWTFDVSNGWGDLDPNGSLELTMWREECKRASTATLLNVMDQAIGLPGERNVPVPAIDEDVGQIGMPGQDMARK
jgi:hypothetical protein